LKPRIAFYYNVGGNKTRVIRPINWGKKKRGCTPGTREENRRGCSLSVRPWKDGGLGGKKLDERRGENRPQPVEGGGKEENQSPFKGKCEKENLLRFPGGRKEEGGDHRQRKGREEKNFPLTTALPIENDIKGKSTKERKSIPDGHQGGNAFGKGKKEVKEGGRMYLTSGRSPKN